MQFTQEEARIIIKFVSKDLGLKEGYNLFPKNKFILNEINSNENANDY